MEYHKVRPMLNDQTPFNFIKYKGSVRLDGAKLEFEFEVREYATEKFINYKAKSAALDAISKKMIIKYCGVAA
jgi:hypothetical protein